MRCFAFFLLLSIASACSAQSYDPDTFRDEMIARFSASNPEAKFSRGAEPLVIDVKGGALDGGTINLHRVYTFCLTATVEDCESERKNLADNLARGAPEPTKESLRIVVRDQQYLDYLQDMQAKEGKGSERALYRQIGEDLYAFVASDDATTIAIVTTQQLDDMGVTANEAWALADHNTKAIIPTLPEPAKLKSEAMAFQGFPYLSALVADLDGWRRISDAVGSDLFMTVVSDQFVFVGLMPDKNVAQFKVTVEEDCSAQPRCVSPNVYRFRDGHWVVAR